MTEYLKLTCQTCGSDEIHVDVGTDYEFKMTKSGQKEVETFGNTPQIIGEPYCSECGELFDWRKVEGLK